MKVDYNIPISKDWVLSKVSEEEIFEKYLGYFPNTSGRFLNTLRGDRHGDCKFYHDNRGVLKFKDFAFGYNWDCFNLVGVAYGTHDFYRILKYICRDFNLLSILEVEGNLDPIPIRDLIERTIKLKPEIRVKRRAFTKADILFWAQFGITEETLNIFNVSSLDTMWINGDVRYVNPGKERAYVYYLPEYGKFEYQCYFPDRLKPLPRFINSNSNMLQGYGQLPSFGNDILITKSRKDVMCLYQFGIVSTGVMSEYIVMSDEQFRDINVRFDNKYTLFDRDPAGKRLTIKYKQKFGTIPLLFDREHEKDFSDNFLTYGYQYMVDFIEYTKEKLNVN